MGILTDFFVLTAHQAALLLDNESAPAELPQVWAKWVDPVKVSTLFRIASNGDTELQDVDEPVDMDRPDGPWLLVIRDEVTQCFAGIAEHEIFRIADAWAATEEWQAQHADPEFLGSLIRDLRDLAKQARPPTTRLYLRITL